MKVPKYKKFTIKYQLKNHKENDIKLSPFPPSQKDKLTGNEYKMTWHNNQKEDDHYENFIIGVFGNTWQMISKSILQLPHVL